MRDACSPDSSRRSIRDGHWMQNYYPNGVPFWTGVQLDEAAFPVLLAGKLRELGVDELVGTDEHGTARARLRSHERPGEPTRPLGGERRDESVHSRGRHLRAGRRGALARAGRARVCAEPRGRLERTIGVLLLRDRNAAREESRDSRILRAPQSPRSRRGPDGRSSSEQSQWRDDSCLRPREHGLLLFDSAGATERARSAHPRHDRRGRLPLAGRNPVGPRVLPLQRRWVRRDRRRLAVQWAGDRAAMADLDRREGPPRAAGGRRRAPVPRDDAPLREPGRASARASLGYDAHREVRARAWPSFGQRDASLVGPCRVF